MKRFTFISLLLFSLAYQVAVASTLQVSPEGASLSIKEISPFSYVCIPHKGPFTDMEKVIGTLMSLMQSQNISPTGPMIGVYYNSPDEVGPEELIWEVGFPVAPQVSPQKPLEKKDWNYKVVLAGIHVGPYEDTGKMIANMMDWMKDKGYTAAGPVMERYLDMDPSKVKKEELKTEIWIPVEHK